MNICFALDGLRINASGLCKKDLKHFKELAFSHIQSEVMTGYACLFTEAFLKHHNRAFFANLLEKYINAGRNFSDLYMQNDSLNSNNPWTKIPLTDYEQHMSHDSVGQLSLLNSLTKKYLAKLKPATCLFMGIAGGNGLEHIDNDISKNVIGIDINREYLDVCFKRYHDRIDSLQLLELDITKDTNRICSADFIWAALVLEYTGIDKCLEFSNNNILRGGHFIVTIQSNNNLQSVSPAGVESVKKAGIIFSPVDPEVLLVKAKELGYALVDEEVNQLPNGKSFLTFDLMYQ